MGQFEGAYIEAGKNSLATAREQYEGTFIVARNGADGDAELGRGAVVLLSSIDVGCCDWAAEGKLECSGDVDGFASDEL